MLSVFESFVPRIYFLHSWRVPGGAPPSCQLGLLASSGNTNSHKRFSGYGKRALH